MVKDEPHDEAEESIKLINDLENNNSIKNTEADESIKADVSIRQIVKKVDKKGNKKYLDGIELMPESEINDKEPTLYYYKRWVWLIFPWACMI